MPTRPRCERALFVMGDKNAGKTFQIRHMCSDKRLGTRGKVPQSGHGVPTKVWLSNERLLCIRTQAPQEAYETRAAFIGRTIRTVGNDCPRWNFVCPMRINKRGVSPGGINLIQSFVHAFSPERVRVAILHPRKDGVLLDGLNTPHEFRSIADQVRRLSGCPIVEPMIVDARRRNGLLLPNFFDFT